MVKRRPASSRLNLVTFFFLLLEFDFLFRQVLLGLLQHLRRFKDFHELQLLGVPVPEQIANVGWLDAALEVLGIGIDHLEALGLEKAVAAQASVFVQGVLVIQVGAVYPVGRPAFLGPGDALGRQETADATVGRLDLQVVRGKKQAFSTWSAQTSR